MNKIKLSLVAAILATTGTFSSVSASEEVELSGNVALTSNYVWRGMTQTSDSPAVQGGIDVSYAGFYVGVWGSAVDFADTTNGTASSEFDIYAGYAGEIDKFSYDVGLIQYMYPNATEAYNFTEAYVSVGYDFDVVAVSAMYSMGIDAETSGSDDFGDAYEFGVSVPLPAEITLDGTYGVYDDENTVTTGSNTNNFGDYYSVSLSKSFDKFDVTIAYTGMDFDAAGTKDQDNLVATVGMSF